MLSTELRPANEYNGLFGVELGLGNDLQAIQPQAVNAC